MKLNFRAQFIARHQQDSHRLWITVRVVCNTIFLRVQHYYTFVLHSVLHVL